MLLNTRCTAPVGNSVADPSTPSPGYPTDTRSHRPSASSHELCAGIKYSLTTRLFSLVRPSTGSSNVFASPNRWRSANPADTPESSSPEPTPHANRQRAVLLHRRRVRQHTRSQIHAIVLIHSQFALDVVGCPNRRRSSPSCPHTPPHRIRRRRRRRRHRYGAAPFARPAHVYVPSSVVNTIPVRRRTAEHELDPAARVRRRRPRSPRR